MNNDGIILDLIKDRCALFGEEYDKLAEEIGISPTQLSGFLKEENEGPLDRAALEKLLYKTGIDLSCYKKRRDIAAKAAEILHNRGISVETLSQEDMINLTGIQEIKYYREFETLEELQACLKSGIIESETTFQYFKALVSLFYSILEKGGTLDDIRPSLTSKIIEKEKEKEQEKEKEKENANQPSDEGASTDEKELKDAIDPIISGLSIGAAYLLGKAVKYLFKEK